MQQTECQRSYLIYILSIVIIVVSSCASIKFKIDKTTLKKYFETNPVFRESHSGLVVYDVEEEQVVFEFNRQKHFTPASNMKLLTYYATVKMMPDSIPALEFCIINDTLFFTGTADPTLLYPNFEYGNTMGFLSENEYQLAYRSKPIADHRFGPGWSWDDYPYYYSAEKSTFPIYGNMVSFKKDSTKSSILFSPNYFKDQIEFVEDSSVVDYAATRAEFENDFIVRYNKASMDKEDAIPFIYSDQLFVNLLSDTLDKKIVLIKEIPDCDNELLYSVPTDSVSKHMLIESDNFLAEHLLLMISNQLGDTLSSEKTVHFMMENNLKELEDEIYWVDGSGLSRYNQVTPNAMVVILKSIYNELPKDKVYNLLPASGTNGTLDVSFQKLKGKIHAKTGSMRHVYNLSGYLETNSGKTLLFSFMNNNFNVPPSELKNEMEKVLGSIVNDK